jgi:hypothetical protein
MQQSAWQYEQSTGNLYQPDGTLLCTGYAGAGQFKNDPAAQSIAGKGPLPCGTYQIAKPIDQNPGVGAFALRLDPLPTNNMFGRSEFFIHGDSVTAPGNASEGCIVAPLQYREVIARSPVQVIVVVSGPLTGDTSEVAGVTGQASGAQSAAC